MTRSIPSMTEVGPIDDEEYLRLIPKAELHAHLCPRPGTFLELAKKNDVPVPTWDISAFWRMESPDDFFRVNPIVLRSLVSQGDFERVTYEYIQDGFHRANLRYLELHFNPQHHLRCGVEYRTALEGIVSGMRAAQTDFGVEGRVLPAILRDDGPRAAVELIREVVAHRLDEVIGIGLDGVELKGPPGQFVEAYGLAAAEGLHCTAHASMPAPASAIQTCMDELGCTRIDHGYPVLEDRTLVERVVGDRIPFTVCPTMISRLRGFPDLNKHPAKAMIEAGINVSLGTDNAGYLGIDLSDEYIATCMGMGVGPARARELSLASVDGAFIDDEDRCRLSVEFTRELDGLEARIQPVATAEVSR